MNLLTYSGLLNHLLSAMVKGLEKYPCSEIIDICRFNCDLWIQLLSRSQVMVVFSVIASDLSLTFFNSSVVLRLPFQPC